MVGQIVEVMVEGESKLVSKQTAYPSSKIELGWERRAHFNNHVSPRTQLVGRTQGDQVVCFDGELSMKGKILDVRITSAQKMTLFAELVEVPAGV